MVQWSKQYSAFKHLIRHDRWWRYIREPRPLAAWWSVALKVASSNLSCILQWGKDEHTHTFKPQNSTTTSILILHPVWQLLDRQINLIINREELFYQSVPPPSDFPSGRSKPLVPNLWYYISIYYDRMGWYSGNEWWRVNAHIGKSDWKRPTIQITLHGRLNDDFIVPDQISELLQVIDPVI